MGVGADGRHWVSGGGYRVGRFMHETLPLATFYIMVTNFFKLKLNFFFDFSSEQRDQKGLASYSRSHGTSGKAWPAI